ncbi:Uncharacterised protein [Mycobacterium tuberculosis]|nr:Uncharacterised protein [Mycobacterium tuberculosis]
MRSRSTLVMVCAISVSASLWPAAAIEAKNALAEAMRSFSGASSGCASMVSAASCTASSSASVARSLARRSSVP